MQWGITMFTKTLLLILLLALAFAPVAAQDAGKPNIAVLNFGSFFVDQGVTGGFFDVLKAYELISAEEHARLVADEDLEGEHINVFWGNADFDFAAANAVVDNAIDRDADYIITLTTPMTQIAVNASADLDEPPIILFASVYNPYAAGIAYTPCIKPDHVTGVESVVPYDEIVPLLLVQKPDLQVIGTIFNGSEASGIWGAERIKEIGEAHGLTVETAAVTGFPDMAPAAEGLISKGVEIFLLPVDNITMKGLPILVGTAMENGIPVFHPNPGSIDSGATVTAGPGLYYNRGVNIGHILVGHLNGTADIARTGISSLSDLRVAVNLRLAGMMDVDIAPELVEKSIWYMTDEDFTMEINPGLLELEDRDNIKLSVDKWAVAGMSMSQELLDYADSIVYSDLTAGHAEFIAGVQCTEEQIAQQRAALDG